MIISADFELAWAWRYVRGPGAKALAVQMARQTRLNVPGILALFDRFEMPITWATVGHLLLERCERQEGQCHADVLRPPHFENAFWRYGRGDWYDDDPCVEASQAPSWYAPDLIQSILAAKAPHEIGCHTFSHVACSEAHCPPEVMDSELAACQRAAAAWQLALRSFIFPGNLAGNFASLRRNGFAAYRWHSGYELDVPRQDGLGLWQIPGGLPWEKPEGWMVGAWIGALRRCVDRALETKTVLHFWFHPSCDPINVELVFPAVLEYVALRRGELWVTTMAGLVDRLTREISPVGEACS